MIQWVPADVSPFRRHRSAVAAPVCSLAVCARVADAVSIVGTGAGGEIEEKVQAAVSEQLAGQCVGRGLRNWYARGAPVCDDPVCCATAELVELQRPAGPPPSGTTPQRAHPPSHHRLTVVARDNTVSCAGLRWCCLFRVISVDVVDR